MIFNRTAPKNRPVTISQMVRNDNPDFELDPWIDDVLHAFTEADEEVEPGNYRWVIRKLKEHSLSWVKLGAFAFHCKVRRIYRNRFRGWRDFCEKVLYRSHWYINRIIQGTRVVKELAENGFEVLPSSESQARELTAYYGEELCQKWQEILDNIPPQFMSAKSIRACLEGEEIKQNRRLEIPLDSWEEFERKAKKAGLNPKEVLDDLLKRWEPEDDTEETEELEPDEVEEVSEEKLALWQEDLASLIDENKRQENWFTKLMLWWTFYERQSSATGVP